jgi:hypothetical protein
MKTEVAKFGSDTLMGEGSYSPQTSSKNSPDLNAN